MTLKALKLENHQYSQAIGIFQKKKTIHYVFLIGDLEGNEARESARQLAFSSLRADFVLLCVVCSNMAPYSCIESLGMEADVIRANH